MRDLFNFLNVDANFIPTKLNDRINVGGPKSSWILSLIVGIVGKPLTKLSLEQYIIRKIYDLGIYGAMRKASGRNIDDSYPAMSSETKSKLNSIYFEEVKKLGQLLDRDLWHWSVR